MMNLNLCISFGTVGKETFITNSKTGKALILDEQGTAIWELVYKGYSAENIINFFSGKFPDFHIQIKKDIQEFILRIQEFGVFYDENIKTN